MKCKECGQTIKEKSLEERFDDFLGKGFNSRISLTQIATDHFKKKFDEALKNISLTTPMVDTFPAIREALFGNSSE